MAALLRHIDALQQAAEPHDSTTDDLPIALRGVARRCFKRPT